MSSRDDDPSTTQRRTIRPQRELGVEHGQACLIVLQGQRLGQRIDLGLGPLLIGRSPEAGLQLLEHSISRLHSRIWLEPSGYRIKDLDSTNKTFINDQPIIEAELKDGDHITIGSWVFKFMDTSSLEVRYHEELYLLATIDPLTELYNRRQFLELLEKELARAASHSRPLALLIIDLDHFKEVNDRYGHPAGDIVLRRVSAILREQAPQELIVSRIGGEEFAIIVPEQPLEHAVSFAEGVRTAVAALDLHADTGPPVPPGITISIGVASRDAETHTVSKLLRAADEQLYRAKQAGRNKVCSPLN